MSKVTAITDGTGRIVAIGHGHLSEKTARTAGSREVQGGLRAGEGQKLHEIDVAVDLEGVETWSELYDKVRPSIS
jgi:hypothetical protein